MPAPHPKEFRDDIVAIARRGEAPISQIARDFGISESCLVVHSDRGSQFRSKAYTRLRRDHHLIGSMGRVASAADNAAMAGVQKCGSPSQSVGHVRPGRVGGVPPRESMVRAMRASGERNP